MLVGSDPGEKGQRASMALGGGGGGGGRGGGGSKCHFEFWKILQFFVISPHNANVEWIFLLKQAQ